MNPTKPQWLVRIWGRDLAQIAALRAPDVIEEDDRTYCYWFNTAAEREAFIELWKQEGFLVVHSEYDPGYDGEELIEPRSLTKATVALRIPSGDIYVFEQSFGYGYPKHSVEYMWYEGNYSCDCNKQLFLARECGVELDEDACLCGDTIQLVSLEVRKEPRCEDTV